jgi:hypothetical protein
VRAYEEALKSGHDPRTHYNLGNALFRSGGSARPSSTTGAPTTSRRAITTSRRTWRSRAPTAWTSPRGLEPAGARAERALRWLSRAEAAMLAGVLFTLAGLALSAGSCGALRRSRARPVCWRCSGSTLLRAAALGRRGGVAAGGRDRARGERRERPGEEFKQVLLLHDGTEVRIREVRGSGCSSSSPAAAAAGSGRQRSSGVY